MATFMDLPKDVRERIYRLHLVRDKPITNSEHHKIVKHRKKFTWGWRATPEKAMPPLLSVSSKIEKEAAPIYYGENHFDLGDIGPLHQDCKILTITWRRHLKFVRKITCTWAKFLDNWGGYGMIGENWKRLSKLKGLEELNIRVDEADLLKFMAVGREVRQRGVHVMSPTPQQQLAILRFPGIAGLLSIQQVKNVKFIERVDENGKKYGGPIAGGALETHILPRLNTSAIKPNKRLAKRPFRFLDLPPELRNRVYDLLLRIPGPIALSKEAPTTAPKKKDSPKITESLHTESALSLLLVSKQINDEAIGLFYNANAFVFYYPIQFQSFLLSIGHQRQQLLRDLNIDYYNLKLGGVDLIDLAFPLLKQLKGLRRLHIVMKAQLGDTNLRQGWLQLPYYRTDLVDLHGANPNRIPGIKHLFDLRGLTDIKVRDVELESKVKELEDEADYPGFTNNTKNRNLMQLSRAYEHFNLALAAAQEGNFNQDILSSPDWHTKETFPDLKQTKESKNNEESGSEGESVDDSEEEDEDQEMEDTEVDSDYDFGW